MEERRAEAPGRPVPAGLAGPSRILWQISATGAVLCFAIGGPASGASIAPPAELAPNLQQALPDVLSIRVSARAGGRRRAHLGFRSVVSNVGSGPLVVDATRAGAGMQADQAILRTDGTVRVRERVGVLRYDPGRGHSHWHLPDFERYELIGLSGGIHRRSYKAGFCLGDRLPAEPSRPPAASRPPMFTHRCGLGRPDLGSLVQGITPGYADDYPPHVEGQSVDVTALHSGLYVLRHRVNPERRLTETDYSDNAASLLLRLRRHEGRKPTLSVIRRCPGHAWCAPGRRRPRAATTGRAS